MKFLVVDSNSLLNRAYYGVKPLTTKDGTYTNAVYGFISIILKILDDVKPDRVAFCFDVKRKTFRSEIFSEYKGTRKETPPELKMQFPLIKKFIELWGYKIVELENYEADDLIGTICHSGPESVDYVIATGDRDSLQLCKKNVSVRLATTKMGQPEAVIYDTEAIFEKYGTTPEGLIHIKALMGDSSDNIPGVAGIGEKGAIGLVSKYGTIENIYENIDALEVSPKIKEKLIAGKDSAFMSKTLGTICTGAPIETDPELYKKGEEKRAQLYEFLTKLEIFSIIKKLGLENESVRMETEKEDLSPINMELVLDENEAEEKLSALSDIYFCLETEPECVLTFESDGKIYTLRKKEIIINALSDPTKKLYCDDSKKLYRFLLDCGSEPHEVAGDISLAAYLLSANMTSYDIPSLCSVYSVPYLSFPEFSGGARLSKAAAIRPLNEALCELLSQTDSMKLYKEIELPLSLVLANMEYAGIMADKRGIEAFGEKLQAEIERLTTSIYQKAGREFNINSPKQLSSVLFEEMGLPGGKKTKNGYSTSADILESLKNDHEIVADILSYRQLSKLNSTYVSGLLNKISENGRIHTTFMQTETRTGRISSVEPNLQNIPVRTPLGREMRKFFISPEGYSLIDADYSQIELRVLSHIADDEALKEAFLSGVDVHTLTASKVFSLPENMITDVLRRRAKAVNFGIVYGIGAFSLSGDLGVSVKEASQYIRSYLDTYSGVDAFMKNTVEDAKKCGYVKTVFGRRRYIPELSASNKMIQSFGQRVAMNAPIQGTAADIIKIAMIKVYRRLKAENIDARLILQIHDELILEAKDEVQARASQILKEEMESAAALSVPLTVDVNIGKSWYDAK